MAVSEFAVEKQWQPNHSSAARWVFSHAARHKLWIVGVLIGALGNALLASVQPIQIGRAFNAVANTPPDVRTLGIAALLVVVTQVGAGWGCNCCATSLPRRWASGWSATSATNSTPASSARAWPSTTPIPPAT